MLLMTWEAEGICANQAPLVGRQAVPRSSVNSEFKLQRTIYPDGEACLRTN